MLEAIAAAVTIIAGIAGFTKWGRARCKKLWRLLTRFRPRVPRETLRIIPDQHDSWWCVGSVDGEPAMQIASSWFVTNVSDGNVMLCQASIRKPKTLGHVFIHPQLTNGYGTELIPPGRTLKATADFWIRPVVCEGHEALVVDVDFVDQFGNPHRVRRVVVSPRPRRKEPGGS